MAAPEQTKLKFRVTARDGSNRKWSEKWGVALAPNEEFHVTDQLLKLPFTERQPVSICVFTVPNGELFFRCVEEDRAFTVNGHALREGTLGPGDKIEIAGMIVVEVVTAPEKLMSVEERDGPTVVSTLARLDSGGPRLDADRGPRAGSSADENGDELPPLVRDEDGPTLALSPKDLEQSMVHGKIPVDRKARAFAQPATGIPFGLPIDKPAERPIELEPSPQRDEGINPDYISERGASAPLFATPVGSKSVARPVAEPIGEMAIATEAAPVTEEPAPRERKRAAPAIPVAELSAPVATSKAKAVLQAMAVESAPMNDDDAATRFVPVPDSSQPYVAPERSAGVAAHAHQYEPEAVKPARTLHVAHPVEPTLTSTMGLDSPRHREAMAREAHAHAPEAPLRDDDATRVVSSAELEQRVVRSEERTRLAVPRDALAKVRQSLGTGSLELPAGVLTAIRNPTEGASHVIETDGEPRGARLKRRALIFGSAAAVTLAIASFAFFKLSEADFNSDAASTNVKAHGAATAKTVVHSPTQPIRIEPLDTGLPVEELRKKVDALRARRRQASE